MASLGDMRPALSVLVVEDDRQALMLVSQLIAKKFPGEQIRSADSGRQGVELCLERLPDIVITDINMAGMDGAEMAGRIKELKVDARFIVLTGYSDQEHLDKFKEIGANAYIVKPINFKKLFDAIQECIDELRQWEVDPDGR